jgi:hypothetical protein
MRFALAFGLLMALSVSADAAAVHHFRARDRVTTLPSEGTCAPPACYKFPGYPPLPRSAVRVLDPSTFGGG